MKFNGNDSSIEINPRKEEVDAFLTDLEGTMTSLSKKSQAINCHIS
jgi:hypothetical protein